MDEDEARSALQKQYDVPRETMARLDAFADLLRQSNQQQNLVSAASLDHLWQGEREASCRSLCNNSPFVGHAKLRS